MKKIVIALGGNALQKNKNEVSAEAQKAVAAEVAQVIARLDDQYKVIISHGNGPQVGNILIHEESASTDAAPAMPLETSTAMSQGQIGYWLAQSLDNTFFKMNKKTVVTPLITQVLVDPNDPAFANPSKPIGQFYTEEEAKKLAGERGWNVREDAGRGWRRVVPSPTPLDVIEKDVILKLLDFDNTIVIAGGGGGIPVYQTENGLVGVDAVIDKDLSSAVLAELIDADIFVSLTAVPNAFTNFGKPEQQAIGSISVNQALEYINQGQFAAGSMLPKIKAAIKFAQSGGISIITSLEKLEDALSGTAGTIIS